MSNAEQINEIMKPYMKQVHEAGKVKILETPLEEEIILRLHASREKSPIADHLLLYMAESRIVIQSMHERLRQYESKLQETGVEFESAFKEE